MLINIGELCPKFKELPNEAKFLWLFTNEDISTLVKKKQPMSAAI
jgi:hypothetical protein